MPFAPSSVLAPSSMAKLRDIQVEWDKTTLHCTLPADRFFQGMPEDAFTVLFGRN